MSPPVRALLRELIDYAGLFPPAGLDMESAVRNYANYLSGEYSWILGRFVVPARRIAEFEKAAAPYFSGRYWKVSILGLPDGPMNGSGYTVEAVELNAAESRISSGQVSLYIEADPEELIRTGARAKIRTGGLTADAVPSAAKIARFLTSCRDAAVAFKATAGLHHPVRGDHPFTMHGFLNVFLAAVMIATGGSEQDAIRLLEERSPAAFSFDDEFICWQAYRFNKQEIAHTRQTFAISFGSCSFDEPIHDLRVLGWL